MVHPGGLLALRLALRAVAKATLSSLVPAVNTAISSIPSLLKVTENMVHPGGFEPPTARFVAEYSIQLSYGCKWRWGGDSNPGCSFWPHTPLAGERLQPLGHLTTRLLRVLRRTCLSLIVAAWRTYYFLRLISQTIFPTLLSFAHFTFN